MSLDEPENNSDDIHTEAAKIYRVVFLGSSGVGKTSIIDQFMSSEHSDVYENERDERNDNIDTR